MRLPEVLDGALLAEFERALTPLVRTTYPARVSEQLRRDAGEDIFLRLKSFAEARQPDVAYARAFTQCLNLWRYSATVEALVRSRRLAGIAARLLGVDGVRLYHDQALYKEAGGGPTPWHVDQYYWPLAGAGTVTVWIPLQPVPLAMGPVAFARGSHRSAVRELAGRLAIGAESERQLADAMAEFEVEEAPFSLGEVSFHGGWTCHGAGANTSDQTRAAFTIIYMDQDSRMLEPEHAHHRGDAALWLPGVRPGDVADSPLNPVLYTRRGT